MTENPYQWTLLACVPLPYSYNFSRIYTDVKNPKEAYELLLKKGGERKVFGPDIKLKNITTGEEITAPSLQKLRQKLIALGMF